MSFVQFLTVCLLSAVVLNPVAAEQLKCWTCSSDTTKACKDALVVNATTDPRIFNTCTNDGDVCKTEITKIGDTILITRGCTAKTGCEDRSGFCETCSSNGCNNKGCNDKTCNKNGSSALVNETIGIGCNNKGCNETAIKKNGSSAVGTSVALIIVSLGFLYHK